MRIFVFEFNVSKGVDTDTNIESLFVMFTARPFWLTLIKVCRNKAWMLAKDKGYRFDS